MQQVQKKPSMFGAIFNEQSQAAPMPIPTLEPEPIILNTKKKKAVAETFRFIPIRLKKSLAEDVEIVAKLSGKRLNSYIGNLLSQVVESKKKSIEEFKKIANEL